MTDSQPPKFAAVGTDQRVKVTGTVRSREYNSASKGRVALTHLHTAATFHPEAADIEHPAKSQVPVETASEFKNLAAAYGHRPESFDIELQGPPHTAYALATIHSDGKNKKDLVGIKASNLPTDDHRAVLPSKLLFEGSRTSFFHSDREGKFKAENVIIDPASLPDHSKQALAIGGGLDAITANTASKGRTATTPDSALAHFATSLGYTLEELPKSLETGETHTIKAPKGSKLPPPTPAELVTAATKKLKETSPPNWLLVSEHGNATALVTTTLVPNDAGDGVAVRTSNKAHHTAIDAATNSIVARVDHQTHERPRATGAVKGHDDSSSSSSSSSSSDSESDDDDDGKGRNTGKLPKDKKDEEMPRRHKSNKKHH